MQYFYALPVLPYACKKGSHHQKLKTFKNYAEKKNFDSSCYTEVNTRSTLPPSKNSIMKPTARFHKRGVVLLYTTYVRTEYS